MSAAEVGARIEALTSERKPHVLGLSGLPGSGKTTVARLVRGAFSMSLDDFYLSKAERAERGLRWRGGPGSHDLELLYEVLERIRSRTAPVTIPRFDHGRDDRGEPTTLEVVPDLVIVEGWFLGYGGQGYGRVRDLLDLLVFIDVPLEEARARRFDREADLRERGEGFAPDEMQAFWDEALAPNIDLLIAEVRSAADVVLSA